MNDVRLRVVGGVDKDVLDLVDSALSDVSAANCDSTETDSK